MIYLTIFFLSGLTCLFAGYFQQKGQRKIAVIFDVLTVLLPTILAGVRNENVGYDIKIYLNNLFHWTKDSNNILDYISFVHDINPNVGIGFSILVYLSSLLSDNVHILYLFSNLMVILFLYLGIQEINQNMWKKFFSWNMLLFLCYNISLNLMRQFCGIALLFYARKFIYKKEKKKYWLSCLIASTFHISALLFLSLYYIYLFFEGKYRELKLIAVILGISTILGMYGDILYFMSNISLIDSYYYVTYPSGFSLRPLLNSYNVFVAVFVVITYIYITHYNYKKYSILYFYTFIIYLAVIFFSLGSRESEAFRIGFYIIPFIPEILMFINQYLSYKIKLALYFSQILILIIYWYLLYIVGGFASTYPYISDFL